MRAFKKAVAFSVVHFIVGLAVAYALTGQAAVALGVALVEPSINAVILFFHARWEEKGGGIRHFHPA
ncbi:MAG TPA: DUF2061 domain-containing protein [Parvibaculum sp.]|jgi:uncharacterized membrane protein